jgi:hypothetical protein
MKLLYKIILCLILAAGVATISACGKPMFAKKNGCGCPDKKGMVGY